MIVVLAWDVFKEAVSPKSPQLVQKMETAKLLISVATANVFLPTLVTQTRIARQVLSASSMCVSKILRLHLPSLQ